jgi:GT2 family glycosyltransferase
VTAIEQRVSVVMLTHNRREEALYSLARLHALPERVPVYLVDNGSTDGTAQAVRERFADVRIVRLERNAGAAGRNAGVKAARTPYIAFCDDDTWWAAGSYARAVEVFDAHPRLAAITGKVLVGREQREDEASLRMAASPLSNELGVPGTQVLGLMAGACIVRREAYLAAGGYEARLFIGGEELLLALDLMSAGWAMAYLPDIVVHHHPSLVRDTAARRRMHHRNALWCAWLRRRWPGVLRETWRLLGLSVRNRALALGVLDAMKGLPWALSRRTPVPLHVEQALQRVHEFYAGNWAQRPFGTLGACRVPPFGRGRCRARTAYVIRFGRCSATPS